MSNKLRFIGGDRSPEALIVGQSYFSGGMVMLPQLGFCAIVYSNGSWIVCPISFFEPESASGIVTSNLGIMALSP